VGRRLGLGRESLQQELKKQDVWSKREVEAPRPKPSGATQVKALPTAEEEFLELLLVKPEAWSGLEFSADDFLEEKHRQLFGHMKEHMERSGKISIPGLYEDMPPESKEWVMQLSLAEKEFHEPLERRDQLVRDIRYKRTREQLSRLKERVAAGQASGDEQTQYKNLLKQVKGSNQYS
jgi:hypothetical protein